MQCYTELAPPTAVSHAVTLPFVSARAANLVVAKSALLQIFELRATVTEVGSNSRDDAADNAAANLDTAAADVQVQRTEHTSRLVLLAECPLAGTVLSVARIRALNTRSKGEALLVAFRDAKLSLVEWDPDSHSLHTISIHYYESADLPGLAPWSADLKDAHNFLTADPGHRCAALKFGAHNLAILPFRQRDLPDDDYDSDDERRSKDAATKGHGQGGGLTPYGSSFVLPLTNLDPTLTHPVHLAFLHEYREPTFGVIAASRATAPSLLAYRKDLLTYTVFTLDLEHKASTTLLSVAGLPYDVSRVVPLPHPIGGALLAGANELIHVDQAGKTNGVAVNEFAKACSAFPLSDQSDLALRLEGCTVELLSPETGDMLIVLSDGRLLVLTFTLDGRTVSGMTVQPIDEEHGGGILKAGASCTAGLGRGRIFVGSEDGESALLGWTGAGAQLRRKQSDAGLDQDDDVSDMEDDVDHLDDDLYNDTTPAVKKMASAAAEPSAPGAYTFRVHDVLPSLAPINQVVLHPAKHARSLSSGEIYARSLNSGDMVAATGRGAAGALTALSRELHPVKLAQTELESAKGLWAVHAKKAAPQGISAAFGEDTEANMSSDVDYDQYLVVCRAGDDGNEVTTVYQVHGNELTATDKGDFEREEGSTLSVGVLARGTKVVQVMRTEVRTYDSELNMDQILPMDDEETGDELHIINASFADPYLLILREDSSVKIFKATGDGELEDVEASGLSPTKWLSASLFRSSTFTDVFAFLLTPEGGLHVFAMSELEKPSYVAEGLGFLPPVLTVDYVPRRSASKASITEILAADLGDATARSPHLIVRTSNDDLVIYKAFHSPAPSSTELWTQNLRWVKLSQQHVPRFSQDVEEASQDVGEASRDVGEASRDVGEASQDVGKASQDVGKASQDVGKASQDVEDASQEVKIESTLLALDNICGYSTVFQRGASPAFIFKESSSAPRVIGLSGNAVKGLTRFHTSSCQRGFAYLDATDTLRISQLPTQTHFGHVGWATRQLPFGSEVHAFTYHPKGLYVVGTGQREEFTLNPDDTYHEALPKEDTAFKPRVERGVLKVIDERTWTEIDTHILDPQEVVLCIETLNLEVSETTHQRKELIAVGTSVVHGEDLATKGHIRIFEVINVVPDPERPETNKRLKLIVKDEVKGAVSAVSELGTQGFLIMAQGQKCMVRGLKEDGTLLPVAFMDMQCYVTALKNLPNTGMLLMGDAFKGVWFTGYSEEPYKMMLFGRSKHQLECITTEFLPFDEQLHVVVADADMNLQILQYDPENPKSAGGSRLLHKSTFHTGHFPTTLTLLQSTLKMPQMSDFGAQTFEDDVDMDGPPDPGPVHHILHTTQSGTIALITPLSESSYRRLSGLSAFLANALESACGLNPKAFRISDVDDGGWDAGVVGRGMVDGNLLMRWGELGEWKRREGMAKAGADEWVFWGEREVLGGWGLFGGRARR